MGKIYGRTESQTLPGYDITIEGKKFTQLRMSDSMTVMHDANKFPELSRFVPEFVASERMK